MINNENYKLFINSATLKQITVNKESGYITDGNLVIYSSQLTSSYRDSIKIVNGKSVNEQLEPLLKPDVSGEEVHILDSALTTAVGDCQMLEHSGVVYFIPTLYLNIFEGSIKYLFKGKQLLIIESGKVLAELQPLTSQQVQFA